MILENYLYVIQNRYILEDDNISENDMKQINPIFEYENTQDLITITGAAVLFYIITKAYDAYKEHRSEAGKKCSHLSGNERKLCINNFRIKGITAQIDVLEKNRSKCSEAKKPIKCTKIINKQIKKLKTDLDKLIKG
jgi:hypothetical protein